MDWCSTQALDFDEPDSSSANDADTKIQVAVLKVLAYKSCSETTHPIYTGRNTIGRGAECNIQIAIPSISIEHALIEVLEDCHLISDLDSRNRTKRRKIFLKPHIKYELKFDDEITFGDVVCRYLPSNESIGDSSILSDHKVNGLASDMILHSDSDSESNSGMGEVSFPVIQETPCNALSSSRISSNASIGGKLDLQSDSETDIEDDFINNTVYDLEENNEKEQKLERVKTAPIKNDNEKAIKVEAEEAKNNDSSPDDFNYDGETQPFPWAKRKNGKPIVSDDDTDVDEDFYNAPTQKFPGFINESEDEEMLNAKTLQFSSDLDRESPNLDLEKEKHVETKAVEENKDLEESSLVVSDLNSTKLSEEKSEQVENIPKADEVEKIEGTVVTTADSNLPKEKENLEKSVENTSTSKVNHDDKVDESVLSKSEASSKSLVLESPLKEERELERKSEAVGDLRRSPELVNASANFNLSILSDDDSDHDEVDEKESTDEDVISAVKRNKKSRNSTPVKGKTGHKETAKNKKAEIEEQPKTPGRLSLRSSNTISKKSEEVSPKFSVSETSAFKSVAGCSSTVVTSTPKKSPTKKVKSPVKSPLKCNTPKSTKRNKRKSTPRKLVLTEEDEDIVLGGKSKPVKRILDSEDEEEPGKMLKRTTRKTLAERRTRSKAPEASTVVTRRSARDIKKPIKFREEDQSSGSSSSTSTRKRSLKCVIKTTRKVEMQIEESQSSVSSTPPQPSTSSTKAIPSPVIKTPPAKSPVAKTSVTKTPPAAKTSAIKTPAKPITAKTPTTRTSRTISTPKRAAKRSASDSSIEESSGSSNEFTETTPTKRARKTPASVPKIAFTGMKSTKTLEKIVKDLGGEVIDSVSECTHLVTDKIRRTCKLLCGISLGCHVLSPDWLKASKVAKRFVSELDHVVKDEEAEIKYGFVLETSLSRAMAKIHFLNNFSIHVTKSVLPPPEEMRSIIESAGGKYLVRMPAKSTKNGSTVIVCGEKEAKSCEKARKAGVHVVTPEFILTGVLRQKAELRDFNS